MMGVVGGGRVGIYETREEENSPAPFVGRFVE